MVDLEDLTLQNAVRLEGVKTHLSDALRAELIGLRDELKRLLDADDEIADLSHRDAQKLYAELDALLVQSFAELADALLLRLHELAQVMAAHESAALSAAGVSDVKTVSAAALSAMLDARVLAVEGIYSEPLLAPFVRHYTDAQKTRIAAVVRQGDECADSAACHWDEEGGLQRRDCRGVGAFGRCAGTHGGATCVFGGAAGGGGGQRGYCRRGENGGNAGLAHEQCVPFD